MRTAVTPEQITSNDVQQIKSNQRPFSSGVSRRVFDLGTHVLKLNTSESHWAGGCAEEISTWELADDELRQYLCPVVAADPNGQWLVMPKCSSAGINYGNGNRRADYRELIDTLDNAGIGDQHPGNVMMYVDPATGDERLVSVDYAYTDERDSTCDCGDGDCGGDASYSENWTKGS